MQEIVLVLSVMPIFVSKPVYLNNWKIDMVFNLFQGMVAVKSICAHGAGPQSNLSDGSVGYSGVRGLALARGGKSLYSGGADGIINQWDISGGVPERLLGSIK